METKVLRSPDYSSNSIVLKTGNDINSKSNPDKSASVGEVVNPVKIKSVEDYQLEYASKLADLEHQKNRLDEREADLSKKEKLLEEDKEQYKIRIEEEVRDKLEKKYSNESAEFNNKVTSLINSLDDAKNNMLTNMEDEISLIVYEATCKIIGKSVIDKNTVISLVREVIKHAQDRMHMIIRVSPSDFELIQESKDILCKGLNNRVDVVADDHVTYGGCIIETDAGSIDGRLEQQLAGLLELISNQRGSRTGQTLV